MLLISPRPWRGVSQHLKDFADAAVYARKTYGYQPVLLAMEPNKDRAVCRQIAKLLAERGVESPVIEASGEADMILGLIRRAQGVLGMRLHALVFAAAQERPFVGVAYDPKVGGFVEYMRQSLYYQIEELNAARMRELVDNVQTQKANPAVLQACRTLAEENFHIAFQLLEQEPGRKRPSA